MPKKRNNLSRDQKRKAKLAKRADQRRKHEQEQKREAIRLRQVLEVSEMMQQRLASMWMPDDIRAMTTDEILEKLHDLGIDFDEAEFRSQVQKFYSPSRLSEHLWGEQMDRAEGADGDFPWLAAIVLWERLCPDVPSTDTINDEIDRGFDLQDDDPEAACDAWLQAWEFLKSRFLVGVSDLESVQDRAGDYCTLAEWILFTVDDALQSVGRERPEYLKKRIALCSEVCDLLPDSDPNFLSRMACGCGESHFMLGDAEAGDAAFTEAVDKYPDYAWLIYSNWADCWAGRSGSKVPADHKRAKQLYEKALELAPVGEEELILPRLEQLEA